MDTVSAGTAADTDIGRAIVESILFNRNNNFGWNTCEHVFTTDALKREYALPKDYLKLDSSVTYTPTTDVTSITGRRVLRWMPMSWIKTNMYRLNEGGEYMDVGSPVSFGIDTGTRTMNLSPAPSDAATVEYTYVKDCGTPWFKSNGTTWTFYSPNTDDTLSLTYTNEWFDVSKGYTLILNRAVYILASRGQGGTEEMEKIALNAMRMWAEEKNRLTAEASSFVSANGIRKRI